MTSLQPARIGLVSSHEKVAQQPVEAAPLDEVDARDPHRLLAIGADKASERAEQTLARVYDRVGFLGRR